METEVLEKVQGLVLILFLTAVLCVLVGTAVGGWGAAARVTEQRAHWVSHPGAMFWGCG